VVCLGRESWNFPQLALLLHQFPLRAQRSCRRRSPLSLPPPSLFSFSPFIPLGGGGGGGSGYKSVFSSAQFRSRPIWLYCSSSSRAVRPASKPASKPPSILYVTLSLAWSRMILYWAGCALCFLLRNESLSQCNMVTNGDPSRSHISRDDKVSLFVRSRQFNKRLHAETGLTYTIICKYSFQGASFIGFYSV
jgi:hypothetical protein